MAVGPAASEPGGPAAATPVKEARREPRSPADGGTTSTAVCTPQVGSLPGQPARRLFPKEAAPDALGDPGRPHLLAGSPAPPAAAPAAALRRGAPRALAAARLGQAPGAGAAGAAFAAGLRAGAALGRALREWRAAAAEARRSREEPRRAADAALPAEDALRHEHEATLQFHRSIWQDALQRTARDAQRSKKLLDQRQQDIVLAQGHAEMRILRQEHAAERLRAELELERRRAAEDAGALKRAEQAQAGLRAEVAVLREHVGQLERQLLAAAPPPAGADARLAEHARRLELLAERRAGGAGRALEERAAGLAERVGQLEQLAEGQGQRERELEERCRHLERVAEERRRELGGRRRRSAECALLLERLAAQNQELAVLRAAACGWYLLAVRRRMRRCQRAAVLTLLQSRARGAAREGCSARGAAALAAARRGPGGPALARAPFLGWREVAELGRSARGERRELMALVGQLQGQLRRAAAA